MTRQFQDWKASYSQDLLADDESAHRAVTEAVSGSEAELLLKCESGVVDYIGVVHEDSWGGRSLTADIQVRFDGATPDTSEAWVFNSLDRYLRENGPPRTDTDSMFFNIHKARLQGGEAVASSGYPVGIADKLSRALRGRSLAIAVKPEHGAERQSAFSLIGLTAAMEWLGCEPPTAETT